VFIQNLLDYIVKVKGKFVHISAMKASGRVEVKLHSLLTSTLGGDGW
jgi:hypothetical protein